MGGFAGSLGFGWFLSKPLIHAGPFGALSVRMLLLNDSVSTQNIYMFRRRFSSWFIQRATPSAEPAEILFDVGIAAIFIDASEDVVMHDKLPTPFIQNHIAWCWAVCARLLGEHYAVRRSNTAVQMASLENAYPFGIPIDDLRGFRREHLGYVDNKPTADLWQWTIAHVSGAGSTGTATDDVKERAVRFVVTGNPTGVQIEVNTYGRFASGMSARRFFEDVLCKRQPKCVCFIGNCFLPESTVFHSVFIKGNPHELYVCDPWDGATISADAEQLFEGGIRMSLGIGTVEWIQYIL
jgi:hypothetical protein